MNKCHLIWLLFLWCCLPNAQSQSPAEQTAAPLVEAVRKGDIPLALSLSELLLVRAVADRDTFLLALVRYNRGRAYLYQKEVMAAMDELGKADSVGRASRAVPTWLRGEVASYRGYAVLYGNSDLENSHAMIMEGLALKQSVAKERPAEVGIPYYHLCIWNQAAGDFRKAVDFGQKAIAAFERNSDLYLSNLAASNNAVGNALSELNSPHALPYLLKAQAQFVQLFGKNINANSASVWYGIGKHYFLEKKYDIAKNAFDSTITHFGDFYQTSATPLVASAQAYLGVCHFGLKNYAEAHRMAEAGIATWHLCGLGLQPDLAAFQFESARALTVLGRLDEAKARFDSSLLILGYKSQPTDVEQDFLHLSGTFDALCGLANVQEKQFRRNGEKKHLESAVVTAKAAADVFYTLRDSLADAATIQAFTDRSYDSIESLLQVLWLADSMRLGSQYLREAFQLAERLRGFVLLKSWFASTHDGRKPPFETQRITLETIQSQFLKPDQNFLEYFVGERHVYMFLLQTKGFWVRRVPIGPSLEKLVSDLRESLTAYHKLESGSPKRTPPLERKSNEHYVQLAGELYQKLLSPIETLLRPNTELIIVPDGVLGLVPFEALLTQKTPLSSSGVNFASLPYLIRRHAVRYGWSVTTLWEMSKPLPTCSSCTGALEFVGFAPFLEAGRIDGKEFKSLRFFGDALNDLLKIFRQSGGGYAAGAAQKSILSKEAHCARYLYLGTHAFAHGRWVDSSYIVFAPVNGNVDASLLFLPEILGDSTRFCRMDLVMLSACQTGEGPNSRGEGLLSLGRAFALNGARSVVHTLWTVREASAGQLGTRFFKEIRENKKSKAAAMHLAKKSIMTDPAHPEWAHPFFWAGFVLTGDGGY